MRKETKKTLVKTIVSVVVIAVVVAAAYLIMRAFGITELAGDDIRAIVDKAGVLGPVVFILITFLQVTLIPIPSTVTVLAGNYLFGVWLSYLYSYIGLILGSAFAFVLGRKLGRPFVDWLAGDKDKVDRLLSRLRGRETVVLFFMFLLPAFPDDLICSLAGILPVSFGVFMLMQLLTRATSVGATLLFMSGEVIPYEGWGLAVIIVGAVLLLVAFILGLKYADKINAFLDSIINRLFKRNATADTDEENTGADGSEKQ